MKIAALILGILLVACGPELRSPQVTESLINEEKERQRELALRLYLEREDRILNISQNLRIAGAPLCRKQVAEGLGSRRLCLCPAVFVRSDNVQAFTDGRKLYITTGMLRFVRNDDELAMVLAHELAHCVLHHVQKMQGNQAAGGLLGAAADIGLAAAGVNTGGAFTRAGMSAGGLIFSQDFEREADYLGSFLAARAGYDITSMATLFRRLAAEKPEMAQESFARTHPTSAERVAAIEQIEREIKGKISRKEPLIPEPLERDHTKDERQ